MNDSNQFVFWQRAMGCGLICCGCVTLMLGMLLVLSIICFLQGLVVIVGSLLGIVCGLEAIRAAKPLPSQKELPKP